MLFHSSEFLKFLGAFLLLHWLVRNNLQWRNLLLVAGSYFFYGWWDWRFLGLILLSTALDYFVGLALVRTRHPARRRALLLLSVTGNLGILGFFKYYGFFVDAAAGLLARAGIPWDPWSLSIVLPVGISFYTFQTMSYTIDVYRGVLPATRNLTAFAAYVAFFPQLVAGPIERARHLLPQFERPLSIDRNRIAEGLWLLIWGLFKKVVLADNLAPLVDLVFDDPTPSGPAVVLATVAFGFQIYCDFSGYSDIARGTARFLGVDIMVNFNIPYAARNLRDFWSRWHISLSTWLRDYLYIPLGGNRRGPARTTLNLLLTMVLGGLWHGAAWPFVLWGLYHGLGLAAVHTVHRRASADKASPPHVSMAGSVAAMAATWVFVFYGWLLFRSTSIDQIRVMTLALSDWDAPAWALSGAARLAAFTLPLIAVECWQNRSGNLLAPLTLSAPVRALLQATLILAIVLYWEKAAQPFLYFQF